MYQLKEGEEPVSTHASVRRRLIVPYYWRREMGFQLTPP